MAQHLLNVLRNDKAEMWDVPIPLFSDRVRVLTYLLTIVYSIIPRTDTSALPMPVNLPALSISLPNCIWWAGLIGLQYMEDSHMILLPAVSGRQIS